MMVTCAGANLRFVCLRTPSGDTTTSTMRSLPPSRLPQRRDQRSRPLDGNGRFVYGLLQQDILPPPLVPHSCDAPPQRRHLTSEEDGLHSSQVPPGHRFCPVGGVHGETSRISTSGWLMMPTPGTSSLDKNSKALSRPMLPDGSLLPLSMQLTVSTALRVLLAA